MTFIYFFYLNTKEIFFNMYFNRIINFLVVSSVCISSQERYGLEKKFGNQSYLKMNLADQSFRYLGATLPVASSSQPESIITHLKMEEPEAIREVVTSPKIGLSGDDYTPLTHKDCSEKDDEKILDPCPFQIHLRYVGIDYVGRLEAKKYQLRIRYF